MDGLCRIRMTYERNQSLVVSAPVTGDPLEICGIMSDGYTVCEYWKVELQVGFQNKTHVHHEFSIT
jgi:hypothetical protein